MERSEIEMEGSRGSIGGRDISRESGMGRVEPRLE